MLAAVLLLATAAAPAPEPLRTNPAVSVYKTTANGREEIRVTEIRVPFDRDSYKSERWYGFGLPPSRTIITLDGNQLLPREAFEWVSKNKGATYKLFVTEVAPDGDPWKCWYELSFTRTAYNRK